MAELTYNIVTQILSGELGGQKIHSYAGSGGRSGTKTNGAYHFFLGNNPFATHIKFDESKTDSVGGPLPLGTYEMVTKIEKIGGKESVKENWIRLKPSPCNRMYGRDGFAIHGRGARGSDGCIVPFDFTVVQAIFKAIKTIEEKRKPSPILKVIAQGADIDHKLKLLKQLA